MNKIVLLIPLLLLTPTLAYAHMSEADRYNAGYKQGVGDASPSNFNATDLRPTCQDHHTVSWCHGYSAGYDARGNDAG